MSAASILRFLSAWHYALGHGFDLAANLVTNPNDPGECRECGWDYTSTDHKRVCLGATA